MLNTQLSLLLRYDSDHIALIRCTGTGMVTIYCTFSLHSCLLKYTSDMPHRHIHLLIAFCCGFDS
eukprot:c37116_g1_i1 orf=84-278(+)